MARNLIIIMYLVVTTGQLICKFVAKISKLENAEVRNFRVVVKNNHSAMIAFVRFL